MSYQENVKKWKNIGAAGLAAAMVVCGTADLVPVCAAQAMNPSAKEYNLSVEDLPDGVGKAYAKFHDKSLDGEDYMLSLFDGYDAMIAMEEALVAAGEDLAGIEYQAMEATVYERDEEGDYYPLDEMKGVTLICMLPENFAKNSGDVQVTAINSKGALCRIDSTIVTVDGKDCVMFDLSVFTTYALLYKQSGKLTSGTKISPTPVPKNPVNNTPTPKPEPQEDKSETPAKTPTPKPIAPTKEPTRQPVPTKEVTKEPTRQPAKSGAASGSSSASAERDKTPQTGDSFSAGRYLMMLAAGGALAGIGIFVGHKKR